jgi:hypothetical protein
LSANPGAAPAAAGEPESRGARIVLPGQAPDGSYVLSVLVKRTFDVVPGGECVPAAEDRPLLPADVFWDDPMNSSVRYESDFVPFKPATDVVLNGAAHAPGGVPTASCTVSLQVGEWRKAITVTGDRVARYVHGGAPAFTDPAPFRSLELRYERAYGGTDVYSDLKVPYPYPRNPLGRGFVVRNTPQSVDNLALPNLEDPLALLTPAGLCLEEYAAWETRPLPAGFGWFPRTWLPRALLAGILPADRPVERELRRAYAQLLPADERDAYLKHGIRDMDFGFFNGASAGGARPYLEAGEWIATENLSPQGRLYFQLPGRAPRIGLDVGEGVREPRVALQTVMIRMDEGQVDLVWRGAVPYRGPDWLPEMRKMDVLVA